MECFKTTIGIIRTDSGPAVWIGKQQERSKVHCVCLKLFQPVLNYHKL